MAGSLRRDYIFEEILTKTALTRRAGQYYTFQSFYESRSQYHQNQNKLSFDVVLKEEISIKSFNADH